MDCDSPSTATDSTTYTSQSHELCRLCANADNQLMHIFNGEGLEHDIYKKIEKHIPIIKITETDHLPQQVCYQCASTLNAWHILYEGCTAADKRLREILRIEEKQILDFDEDDCITADDTSTGDTLDEKYVAGRRTSNRERSSVGTKRTASNDWNCSVSLKRICTVTPEHTVKTVSKYDCSHCSASYKMECVLDHHIRVAHSEMYAVERMKKKQQPEQPQSLKTIATIDVNPKVAVAKRKNPMNDHVASATESESKNVVTVSGEATIVHDKPITIASETANSESQQSSVKRGAVFKCEHCSYSTTKKHYVRNHIRRAHSGKRERETFTCATCSRHCSFKSTLIRHIRKFHMKTKNVTKGFACDICNRGYVFVYKFLAHRMCHEFVQPLAWRDFTNSFCRIKHCDTCDQYYKACKGWTNHMCKRERNRDDEEQKALERMKPRYKCTHCDMCFCDKWVYRQHRMVAHPDAEPIGWLNLSDQQVPFYCESCFVTMDDEQSKSVHVCREKSQIDLKTAHVCKICHSNFRGIWHYRRHMQTRHRSEFESSEESMKASKKASTKQSTKESTNDDNDAVKREKLCKPRNTTHCPSCGKAYRLISLVLSHMEEEHGIVAETPYLCLICSKMFKRGTSLVLHNRLYHPKDENEEETNRALEGARITLNGVEAYHCVKCNRHYMEKLRYLAHWRMHNAELRFTCDLCGKQARTQNLLKNHIRNIHLNIRNHKCDICGKGFHNNQMLIEHRRIHTGEKPFSCEKCGKTFVAMNALHTHRKFHDDFYAYCCQLCPKKFKIRRSLTNHIRTHTGERPFRCEVCGKTYSNSSRYSYHKRVTHSENRPFRCEQCGSCFKANRYLQRHIKLHMTRERPIQFKRRNNPEHFGKQPTSVDDAADVKQTTEPMAISVDHVQQPHEGAPVIEFENFVVCDYS